MDTSLDTPAPPVGDEHVGDAQKSEHAPIGDIGTIEQVPCASGGLCAGSVVKM